MKKLTDKAKKAINEAIKEESSLLGCGIEKIEDIEKAQAVVLRERETSLCFAVKDLLFNDVLHVKCIYAERAEIAYIKITILNQKDIRRINDLMEGKNDK